MFHYGRLPSYSQDLFSLLLIRRKRSPQPIWARGFVLRMISRTSCRGGLTQSCLHSEQDCWQNPAGRVCLRSRERRCQHVAPQSPPSGPALRLLAGPSSRHGSRRRREHLILKRRQEQAEPVKIFSKHAFLIPLQSSLAVSKSFGSVIKSLRPLARPET